MSKITDYLEDLRRRREIRTFQTVSQFADELRKPEDFLLDQLAEAGVIKHSGSEQVTEEGKQKLLQHLQGPPRSRRKKINVTIEPASVRLWRAVAAQENGAEWDCLRRFTDLMIVGDAIDDELQRLVNLIVAKSFVGQALPKMRRGRPKSDELDSLGREVAQRYWDMRDAGVGYSEAVTRLAEDIHKDERHVMRPVEKNKKSVGLTPADRAINRRWNDLMRTMYEKDKAGFLESYARIFASIDEPTPKFQVDEYLNHLDEVIRTEAKAKKPLTKKI